MQTHDLVEEVDLGNGKIRKPTYISVKIDLRLKTKRVTIHPDKKPAK